MGQRASGPLKETQIDALAELMNMDLDLHSSE